MSDELEIPKQFTAANAAFPEFSPGERREICFNLQEGDVGQQLEVAVDPYVHWQGCYFELDADGVPRDEVLKEKGKLLEIAAADGVDRLRAVLPTLNLEKGSVAFYSPGKAKRWGALLGPDGVKPLNSENLLVKRPGSEPSWLFYEVHADGTHNSYTLTDSLLRLVTYTSFAIQDGADIAKQEREGLYGKSIHSEVAWLIGSTLLRKSNNLSLGRVLNFIPRRATQIRFIRLESRDAFLHAVAGKATFTITGATLNHKSSFASPMSTEVASQVGEMLGCLVAMPGYDGPKLMADASMNGHKHTMSADRDFGAGFTRSVGRSTVHFKGQNMVRLHGDMWAIKEHGVTYMLEEREEDFSNHAKEACLMAAATHPKSVAILAGGGPTVAQNLCRLLLLCGEGRVFAFAGMHSAQGQSGACGNFKVTEQQMHYTFESLTQLAPDFFGAVMVDGKSVADLTASLVERFVERLSSRPLQIIPVKGGLQKYVSEPNTPNKAVHPGVMELSQVYPYAFKCVQWVWESAHSGGEE